MKERGKDVFTEFMNYSHGSHGLTKPELQIVFFRIYKKHISIEIQSSFDKDSEKAVDRLLCRQSVKDKYNKMTVQALKSYCKNNMSGTKYAVRKCHHPKSCLGILLLMRVLCIEIGNIYGRIFLAHLLLNIDDLIGSDEKYCDMEGNIERLFLPNILLTISLLELWNVKMGFLKV